MQPQVTLSIEEYDRLREIEKAYVNNSFIVYSSWNFGEMRAIDSRDGLKEVASAISKLVDQSKDVQKENMSLKLLLTQVSHGLIKPSDIKKHL